MSREEKPERLAAVFDAGFAAGLADAVAAPLDPGRRQRLALLISAPARPAGTTARAS